MKWTSEIQEKTTEKRYRKILSETQDLNERIFFMLCVKNFLLYMAIIKELPLNVDIKRNGRIFHSGPK
jgi:hypothetical protein